MTNQRTTKLRKTLEDRGIPIIDLLEALKWNGPKRGTAKKSKFKMTVAVGYRKINGTIRMFDDEMVAVKAAIEKIDEKHRPVRDEDVVGFVK